MKIDTYKKLLFTLFFINVFILSDALAQKKYGKLKLKVIQTYPHHWDELELTNNDTTFIRYLSYYPKKSILDSIPQGKYTAKLISVFGHKVEKQVVIKNKNKITFKVNKYYKKDTSRIKFLNRIGSNDTLKIYSRESGCFHSSYVLCWILHTDRNYVIVYDSIHGIKKSNLSETELEDLQNLESIGRSPNNFKAFSTTRTHYTWVIRKEIIEFERNGPSYIENLIDGKKKESSKKP